MRTFSILISPSETSGSTCAASCMTAENTAVHSTFPMREKGVESSNVHRMRWKRILPLGESWVDREELYRCLFLLSYQVSSSSFRGRESDFLKSVSFLKNFPYFLCFPRNLLRRQSLNHPDVFMWFSYIFYIFSASVFNAYGTSFQVLGKGNERAEERGNIVLMEITCLSSKMKMISFLPARENCKAHQTSSIVIPFSLPSSSFHSPRLEKEVEINGKLLLLYWTVMQL